MYLLYSRVSSLDQAGEEKVSIPTQIAAGKAIAAARGAHAYDVATYIDRGVSGSIALDRRPAGKELLNHANIGDCIVASKLDRIFRSASDALKTIDDFKRKGIKLIICDMGIDPVGDSPATMMFFGMLSLVAQFERERLHERVTEGRNAKRTRGGHVGGLPPFGYKKIGTGKTAMLVRCDKEQAHIRKAKELLNAADRTSQQVARLMASEGMVGRDGKPYSAMAIYRMTKTKYVPPRKPVDVDDPRQRNLNNEWQAM